MKRKRRPSSSTLRSRRSCRRAFGYEPRPHPSRSRTTTSLFSPAGRCPSISCGARGSGSRTRWSTESGRRHSRDEEAAGGRDPEIIGRVHPPRGADPPRSTGSRRSPMPARRHRTRPYIYRRPSAPSQAPRLPAQQVEHDQLNSADLTSLCPAHRPLIPVRRDCELDRGHRIEWIRIVLAEHDSSGARSGPDATGTVKAAAPHRPGSPPCGHRDPVDRVGPESRRAHHQRVGPGRSNRW